MSMTLDDLFFSALVALGPPDKIPNAYGKSSISASFTEKVGEYNHFITENFGLVMPENSYMAYSKWFHKRRR